MLTASDTYKNGPYISYIVVRNQRMRNKKTRVKSGGEELIYLLTSGVCIGWVHMSESNFLLLLGKWPIFLENVV